MNPPAKLSELIDCLDFESEFSSRYFDRKTGLVVTVEKSLLQALENDDEAALEDLPEWEKEDIELAREIINDDGPEDRFIDPPDKFEFHEYRQMEHFIGTLTDTVAIEQLSQAIRGKGAFRYFKDTLDRLGLRDQWFSFRDSALKKSVLRWASANNVTVDESR